MEVAAVYKVPVRLSCAASLYPVLDLKPDLGVDGVPSALGCPEIDAGRLVSLYAGMTIVVVGFGRVAALIALDTSFYVAPPAVVSGSEFSYWALH